MRVCVDIQPAVAQRAGIGRYTAELVTNLARQRAGRELRLFYFDFLRRARPPLAEGAEMVVSHLCPGRLVQSMWRHAAWPPFDLFAGQADVYHFTNFTVPPLSAGRAVVTIHDAAFVRLPETVEDRNLASLRVRVPESIRRADAVIAVSKSCANDVVELLHADPAKVHVVYEGIRDTFAPPGEEQKAAVRRRLGLTGPYLLTVGTLEPRKNLPFLVDVFERMDRFDGQFVVAGAPGWKCGPIIDRLRTSKRAADIIHADYVPDGDLCGLYGGAELFMCASLYEGFGFPPLEAMACGAPVLSSACGSLAEVLGDGARIVGKFDADLWASEAMRTLADGELARRGRARAARYRWDDAARGTWEVYERIAGAKR